MKITRFSRIEANRLARPAPGLTPDDPIDAEHKSDSPRPQKPAWEPSTWIKPPSKAQLMAGR